jgi:RecG-like helicase
MSEAPVTTPTPNRNAFRRAIDRLTSTSEEMDARELLEESIERGSTPVGRCRSGERVTVSGTIKALTLRPVGGVPALEAELFDGSGMLMLVWLGRRRIVGIDPGRSLTVHGRVTLQNGHRVMFNPAYELRT